MKSLFNGTEIMLGAGIGAIIGVATGNMTIWIAIGIVFSIVMSSLPKGSFSRNNRTREINNTNNTNEVDNNTSIENTEKSKGPKKINNQVNFIDEKHGTGMTDIRYQKIVNKLIVESKFRDINWEKTNKRNEYCAHFHSGSVVIGFYDDLFSGLIKIVIKNVKDSNVISVGLAPTDNGYEHLGELYYAVKNSCENLNNTLEGILDELSDM